MHSNFTTKIVFAISKYFKVKNIFLKYSVDIRKWKIMFLKFTPILHFMHFRMIFEYKFFFLFKVEIAKKIDSKDIFYPKIAKNNSRSKIQWIFPNLNLVKIFNIFKPPWLRIKKIEKLVHEIRLMLLRFDKIFLFITCDVKRNCIVANKIMANFNCIA